MMPFVHGGMKLVARSVRKKDTGPDVKHNVQLKHVALSNAWRVK